MRRRRLLFRGGIAVLLTAALLTTAQSSRADDEPEWYPGLPDATFGNWSNAPQGGLSYAKRAKQWFRTPITMTVAEVINDQDPSDHLKTWIRAEAYFVSPTGAPTNYGYLPPMTVRSVGFGLMPVEATVQISQRTADGYPLPLKVLLRNTFSRPDPRDPNREDVTTAATTVEDSFNIQIISVRVDGVDLALNGECRTAEPAPATLTSPEYTRYDHGRNSEVEWFRTHDPSTYYHPIYGGELSGSMTIPAFTGCTTAAGDDLSRLMTLSVSGPDNPVVARTGWPCAFVEDGISGPAPPGASNPKLGTEAGGKSDGVSYCAGVKPFEYPQREDH